MKVVLIKTPQDGFGGTFPLEAELSEEVVDELGMRRALTRFACRLLDEENKRDEAAQPARSIVGVELHRVVFSFVLAPREPAGEHRLP